MDVGQIPEGLKYTKEHEWIKVNGNEGTVGITDYAQHALTDVVFVELPEIGKKVQQLKAFCTIESVKSVSDIFAPASGEVIAANKNVSEKPELVNQSPYENGWIAKIKISNKDELNNLMGAAQYKAYLEGLGINLAQ